MKKILGLIGAALITAVCAANAYALEPVITDEAGVLHDSGSIELILEDIRGTYETDAAVVIVSGYDEESISGAAQSRYMNGDYGSNDEYSCIMLFIDSNTGNYYIGDFNSGIDGSGIDMIDETVGTYLSNGDYYSACYAFAENTRSLLEGSISSLAVQQTAKVQPAVVDSAGYMSSQEKNEVSSLLERIRDTYNVDAAVVTVESYDQRNMEAAADDYYDYGGYGFGSDHSGFMLMICKGTREYHITTCGSSIKVLNDSAIDYLCDKVETYLRKDDYYNACRVFAEETYEIYEDYDKGTVFAKGNKSSLMYYVIGWIIAALAALAATFFAKSTMNDAVKKAAANEYVKQGSVNITRANDVFLYSTVTRTKKVKETSAGSTTHTSSTGTSHGGGGGSF